MSLAGKPRKHYTAEFREKAAALVNERGYTIDQVAVQLGVARESVRRWKEAAKAKLDPPAVRQIEHDESELKRLRKENTQLKTEVDILKKATAYFARETM